MYETKTTSFTESERMQFEKYIHENAGRLNKPTARHFLILLDIARATINATPMEDSQWVHARTLYPKRRDAECSTCWSMVSDLVAIGLVRRRAPYGERSQHIQLTTDGKAKLIGGIKLRRKNEQISDMRPDQVCSMIAEDEYGDWRSEMIDRISATGCKTNEPRQATREDIVENVISAAMKTVNPGVWGGLLKHAQMNQ